MSSLEQEPPQQEDARRVQRPSRTAAHQEASGAFNVFSGIVMSRADGLTRTTLRIRIGERTVLRVRWLGRSAAQATHATHSAIDVGQPVRVVIPEEAVRLEVGGFRRGKQRWNRWIGQVVLVYHSNHDQVTTVKIHHNDMTLRSRGPVIGVRDPLMTWDAVNVVVDPQQVRLIPLRSSSSASRNSGPAPDSDPPLASVWLRATVQSLRSTPTARHIALNVGGANVAVLVEATGGSVPFWNAGVSVEISIGHGEAWIRRDAGSGALPCCVLDSSEFEDP